MSNALGAADNGAQIKTRTKVVSAKPTNGNWLATIEDRSTGNKREVMAKVIVNAAGPGQTKCRHLCAEVVTMRKPTESGCG